MKTLVIVTVGLLFSSTPLLASEPDLSLYRSMTNNVRDDMKLQLLIPLLGKVSATTHLVKSDPIFEKPIVSDFFIDPLGSFWIRNFWDKVFVTDDSNLVLNGETIPITCIFINGQDNRFSGKDTPLIPDFFMQVYLVANDYTCTGPINPNWPLASGKKETWDTYVYYEIRDPTIMLPTEIKIRYRWEEYKANIQ